MSERDLWCKVIHQAIGDATIGDFRPSNASICTFTETPAERLAERENARSWFRDGGEDFSLVCSLAGLEPDAVRERALAMFDESQVAA